METFILKIRLIIGILTTLLPTPFGLHWIYSPPFVEIDEIVCV